MIHEKRPSCTVPLDRQLDKFGVLGPSRPEREPAGTICYRMSLRQIDMAQCTYLQVKELFMLLFCTTRTGIADPTIRHVKRRTFLVADEGEYDSEQGDWVIEEETGEETTEDDFWVFYLTFIRTKFRVHHEFCLSILKTWVGGFVWLLILYGFYHKFNVQMERDPTSPP